MTSTQRTVADPAAGPTPDYERPPVVETVLGVQFEWLPRFTNAHLGLFWHALGIEEWPTAADAPPLTPQFETFGETAKWSRLGATLMVTQDPAGRVLIKNKAGDRLIQLQNGRLHFNWLGDEGREYPRYPAVREGFAAALRQFGDFVAEHELGDFRPNQWEVTYINHIPRGTVWQKPSDWAFFLPLGGLPTVKGVVDGESFTGQWHFVIPGQRGRLHVEWQHGTPPTRKQPGRELIRLTLTARGPLEQGDGSFAPILSGIDLGRETIVRSFQSFASEEANKHWVLR
jgi:uncharacterized protein (TIGR04255 family)